jgi:magnesium transporter
VCELHREHHFDLILLDLLMPVMDGFQVIENLKQIEDNDYIPVLVITAQPDHKLRALQAGARDFITKPFELPEVLARVHNMLEVRLLHEETNNYSKELEQKVIEVKASHEQIRLQSVEVQRLYDANIAEQQRSHALSLHPAAMVGVVKEERFTTPWFQSFRLRHPWLQINLLTAFIAAGVVGMFQETLDRLLILTIFLPVLADQSSNTGSQALAITLRGLIQGDLKTVKEKALIRKEAILGLLNGALIGMVAAIGMYVVATFMHLQSANMLSLVVFLAMVGSCILSGICGVIVPFILKRFGHDPVTASSIFLTTATNIASMGLLLGLAKILVK